MHDPLSPAILHHEVSMSQRLPLIALLAIVVALLCPLAPAIAAPAPAPLLPGTFTYFPQTGHNISLKIKQFYDTHGGLDIFGLPLTELFAEDGMQVQYFER